MTSLICKYKGMCILKCTWQMCDLPEVGNGPNRDLSLFLSELLIAMLQCPLFESADLELVFT